MFKQRLLTTIILTPLVLLAIYLANPLGFILLVVAIMLLCGHEFLPLIPMKSLWKKIFYLMALFFLTLLFSHFYFHGWIILGLILWLMIAAAEMYFPKSQNIWGKPTIVALSGLLLLPLFAESTLRIYSINKNILVYSFFLVWAVDIGAYIVGKRWGKNKLIPNVSPGKTVEGLIGGAALSLIVAIIAYFIFQPLAFMSWFILAIITILASIVGDLFISMLKRRCNVKDTGCLLPGHGGLLDRLDSLIAAMPIFYAGLAFL